MHNQGLNIPHFKLKLRAGQEYQLRDREKLVNRYSMDGGAYNSARRTSMVTSAILNSDSEWPRITQQTSDYME